MNIIKRIKKLKKIFLASIIFAPIVLSSCSQNNDETFVAVKENVVKDSAGNDVKVSLGTQTLELSSKLDEESLTLLKETDWTNKSLMIIGANSGIVNIAIQINNGKINKKANFTEILNNIEISSTNKIYSIGSRNIYALGLLKTDFENLIKKLRINNKSLKVASMFQNDMPYHSKLSQLYALNAVDQEFESANGYQHVLNLVKWGYGIGATNIVINEEENAMEFELFIASTNLQSGWTVQFQNMKFVNLFNK